MFDGAAVAIVDNVATQQLVQHQTETSSSPDDAPTSDSTLTTAPTGEPQFSSNDQALFDALAANDASKARQEIVFVSPSVRDYEKLLDGISPTVEVVVLDPTRDGVAQMAEVLAGRTGIDTVHLIAEGNEAQLHLGTSFLTRDSISTQYAEQFQQIGQSLSTDADVLIYGCNFGRGEAGQLAISTLASLTGADVAASTDRTGHSSEFGNWILETSTDAIESSVVIGETGQTAWKHALATYTVTNTNDSGAGSLRQAITDANANVGADTIAFAIGSGAQTIALSSALPTITEQVTIDGWTQTGFAGTPLIRIDGNGAAGASGLVLSGASDFSIIRGLVITRFAVDGILVQSGADNITIRGNWIGTSGTGSTGMGNSDDGIDLASSGAVIGGTGANDRNVITHNADEGITIVGSGTTGHLIQGNYIGVDPDGATGNGNTDVGIAIISGSGNTIGGTTTAARNVISRNFEGIEINTANNVVQGNYIGTDAGGTLNRGNRSDDGVEIQGSSTGNTIGGTVAGAGNLIAYNFLNGVNVVNGSGHAILGNQIHSNTTLGINLGTAGVTSNDTGDGDSGANNLINFPVIYSVTISSGNVTITGEARPGAIVEFFESPDAAGVNGEGQTFIGRGMVSGSTAGTLDATARQFSFTFAVGTLVPGDRVTATATDASNNTSEFAVTVAVANTSPTITSNGGGGTASISVAETITAVTDVNATDTEAPPQTLTYSISGVDAGDFTIDSNTGVLTFASAPDFENPTDSDTNNVYQVTVQASDGNGGTDTQDLTITVTDVASTLVVTTTSDADDTGLGASYTIEQLNVLGGAVSLREAITASNSTAGTDTINFNIPGAGPHTINVLSALPTITQTVIIDGTTEPDFGTTPIIELNGASAGAVNGLVLGAGSGGSIIRGLVIQNFNRSGILVQSANNVIASNYIGLDSDGTTIASNNTSNTTSLGGIRVETSGNIIGGLTPADRNVISGNLYSGIVLFGSSANSNIIRGNYIGTDAGGTLDRGNDQEGIDIDGGSNNVIGGDSAAARNVISGNGSDGIEIDSGDNNIVQGNYIGSDYTGTIDVGNTRDGIDINENAGDGATGTLIGSNADGTNDALEGNLIFGNNINGIEVRDNPTIGNRILGNIIYGNTALGIELGTGDGVTGNDGGDGDSGPNNLMNFPVIYSVTIIGGNVTISGEARPGATVEFFESPQATGVNGQAQTFIGRGTVAAAGTAGTVDPTAVQFSFTFAVGSLVVGDRVTATATTVADGTSEFSVNVVANAAPVVSGAGGTLAYTEGDPAMVIDGTLTVSDVDSATLTSATVTISGGFVSGEDVLAFTNTGTITGSYNPGTGILTLTGTDTLANYEAALESITYQNTNTNNPNTGARTVTWVVNDGVANSAAITSTITVAAVNDAPVVMAPGAALSGTEQVGLGIHGTGFGVSDVDAGGGSTTATLSVGEGTLTVVAGTSGVTIVSGNGTGTVTLSGTIVQINNLLTGGGTGTITYLNGLNVPSASTNLTVTVNDQGNTGSDPGLTGTGTTEEGTNSVTINVSAVNDDPTNVGSLPTDVTVTEDVLSNVDLSLINLSDVDAGGGNLSMTLTAATGGNLTATSGGGVTVAGSGTGVLTLTGSQANLNTYLGNAANVQYLHGSLNTNGDNADTITVQVTDNGNTGNGGGGTITLGTVNVDIAAVNDAPVNQVPGAQTVAEDTPLALSGVSVTDVDGNLSTVQLGVLNGTVTVTLQGAVTLSAGANGTSTLTLSGSQADINATLATLVYQGSLNYAGPDTLTVTSTDSTSATDVDTVAITVSGVNDAPVMAANIGSTVARGGIDVITNAELRITDVDNTPGQLIYTVTVGPMNGQLELTTTPGVAITTFTQAQIDAGQVIYVHDGSFTASDSFTFTANDGAGGNIGATTFGITVTPANSVPTLVVNAGSTVTQGLTDVITAGELQVVDLDNSSGQLTYTIITSPLNGQLELTTAPGVAITTFTQADIDAGRVVFAHSGAAATNDRFTFTVSDGAGGTIGATTFTFTVAPFIPPPGGGGGGGGGSGGGGSTGGSGGTGSGSGSGTGSGSGSSSGGVQPPIQPPSVMISTAMSVRDASVVGATNDPMPRSVIANRTFVRVEQPNAVVQKSSTLPAEPLSLPVKKVLAVGHKLVERLTRLADDLERGVQEREYQSHLVGRVASFSGMALSAGFVAWLLRGGSLVASFLVSMPAWRHFDPLPVLGMREGGRRKHDRKVCQEDEQESRQFRGLDQVLKSSSRHDRKKRRA